MASTRTTTRDKPPTGSSDVDIDGVTVAFEQPNGSEVVVVSDVSVDIRAGEFVCLVGPSGCGKSTLLNVVAGLLAPAGGSVSIDGVPAGNQNGRMGYMFQGDTLLPWNTALDNVILPMQARGGPVDKELAGELLRKVGLSGFEHHYPRQMSGGMRKRAQLARLRAQDPDVMLMDEPFGGLDAQTKLMIQEEFLAAWDEDPKTTIFVTHDLSEAIGMADRIVLMTTRPARIRSIYTVPFERPRAMSEITGTPEYRDLFQELWESLRVDNVLVARGEQG